MPLYGVTLLSSWWGVLRSAGVLSIVVISNRVCHVHVLCECLTLWEWRARLPPRYDTSGSMLADGSAVDLAYVCLLFFYSPPNGSRSSLHVSHLAQNFLNQNLLWMKVCAHCWSTQPVCPSPLRQTLWTVTSRRQYTGASVEELHLRLYSKRGFTLLLDPSKLRVTELFILINTHEPHDTLFSKLTG